MDVSRGSSKTSEQRRGWSWASKNEKAGGALAGRRLKGDCAQGGWMVRSLAQCWKPLPSSLFSPLEKCCLVHFLK